MVGTPGWGPSQCPGVSTERWGGALSCPSPEQNVSRQPNLHVKNGAGCYQKAQGSGERAKRGGDSRQVGCLRQVVGRNGRSEGDLGSFRCVLGALRLNTKLQPELRRREGALPGGAATRTKVGPGGAQAPLR